MSWFKKMSVFVCASLILAGAAMAGEISMKLSGPGVVNDSTIKAGQSVSADLYFSNDKVRRGISFGLKFTSDNIKRMVHVADSGNGLNDVGDVKGYNGWQDKSVFDFTGVIVSQDDWDGVMPDTIGFAGIVIKKRWQPQDLQKQLSITFMMPDTGTVVVDSSFFPPGGDWMYDNNDKPEWGGPYKIKVVK
jgi:hypothetical protein